VEVESYGAMAPLKNLANISCPDPKTVKVEPWDKSVLAEIEKAITAANIGINPQNMGEHLFLPIPPMTEDRRKQMVKFVLELAEKAKISVLDSNQTVRKKPKTNRNRALNVVAKFKIIRQFGALLRGSTLLTLACSFMLLFTLFAVFSPYFDLKKVEVKRNSPHIDVQAVENLMAEFYGRNLLFLPKDEARELLLKTFAEFRSVTLNEKWPDSLVITIDLSPPFYQILNEHDATFSVISEDGVVLRQEATEGLPLLKLKNYEQPLVAGENFTTPKVLQDITYLRELFAETLKITVGEIRYLPLAYEVHLVSSNQ